jgi:hypothetical protein
MNRRKLHLKYLVKKNFQNGAILKHDFLSPKRELSYAGIRTNNEEGA